MRKNLSVLLVGVLIGGLLFLAYPTTAATTSKRLKKLENKVETLQKKTRLLTKEGFYRSFIIGSQVLSVCLDGGSATWTNPIDDVTEIDTCVTSPKSTQQLRERLGQR